MPGACSDAPLEMGEYSGVVIVTAAYFVVYYALMVLQIHGKKTARAARCVHCLPACLPGWLAALATPKSPTV